MRQDGSTPRSSFLNPKSQILNSLILQPGRRGAARSDSGRQTDWQFYCSTQVRREGSSPSFGSTAPCIGSILSNGGAENRYSNYGRDGGFGSTAPSSNKLLHKAAAMSAEGAVAKETGSYNSVNTIHRPPATDVGLLCPHCWTCSPVSLHPSTTQSVYVSYTSCTTQDTVRPAPPSLFILRFSSSYESVLDSHPVMNLSSDSPVMNLSSDSHPPCYESEYRPSEAFYLASRLEAFYLASRLAA